MIPKSQILFLAKQEKLLATTIEKDYVLGWLLFSVAAQSALSNWVFKGGTCLKKCFFETYRFSEDLDFTVPPQEPFDEESILANLMKVAAWIEERSGIQFPKKGIEVEKYENKGGKESVQARMTFTGPLDLPNKALQRVKFDLTQDEIIVEHPRKREVFHPYDDRPESSAEVLCYTVDEVLAEKTRALYERQGRVRDLYDLVHLSRNFRDTINPQSAKLVLQKKFAYKNLPEPNVAMILERFDRESVRANWKDQLSHQLPTLPSVEIFLEELTDAIAWWLEPNISSKEAQAASNKPGEAVVRREPFPTQVASVEFGRRGSTQNWYGSATMNEIVYSARNRLLVILMYKNIPRLVEPYSLRRPNTGNLLLYAHEVQRGNSPGGGIKAFNVSEIQSAKVSTQSFKPRFLVEL